MHLEILDCIPDAGRISPADIAPAARLVPDDGEIVLFGAIDRREDKVFCTQFGIRNSGTLCSESSKRYHLQGTLDASPADLQEAITTLSHPEFRRKVVPIFARPLTFEQGAAHLMARALSSKKLPKVRGRDEDQGGMNTMTPRSHEALVRTGNGLQLAAIPTKTPAAGSYWLHPRTSESAHHLQILNRTRPDIAEVLGHEGAGVVVEAGPGAPMRPGDRVVFNPSAQLPAAEFLVTTYPDFFSAISP